MSTVESTAEEMFESLTGFEEIAISKHFGSEWQELAEKKPVLFLRALAFVDLKRGGEDDRKARDAALGLTVRQAQDYFAPDEDEIDPDEPETEPGKD